MKRYHFHSIDSTNEWAKRSLKQGELVLPCLVTAEMQTAGRGRFSRKWLSPAGEGLYLTYLLETALDPLTVTRQFAEMAVKMLVGFSILTQIKWPNDLMIDGKKVAGILTETVHYEWRVVTLIGFGLNVNTNRALLETVGQPATSLCEVKGERLNCEEILQSLVEHLLTAFK